MSRLVERIRAKLDVGALPAERPAKLIAGYGENERCSACDAPILGSQIEWSIRDKEDRVAYRFHLGCHGLWEAALRKRGLGIRDVRGRGPHERVGMQIRTHPGGLCLPCLSNLTNLALDVVAVVLAQLAPSVYVYCARGTCAVCGGEHPLVRRPAR